MTVAPERERRRLLCLNGPNLLSLGRREPDLYGGLTLAAILERLRRRADALGVELRCVQSNHEGVLIDELERATDAVAAICNPGGLSHTSIALRDALAAFARPVVEVHLTNVHAREPFRHRLLTAGAARGVIAGLGAHGYELALEAAVRLCDEDRVGR
ncbi:MAG TPA: type II 3-dehydroquinate dehydratase [Candidatus Micrarchaeia archaeon]|nr:type II 3-dehydroquinate dehydratase [Candidatus Micrarchaeia archaeon]